MEAHPIPQNVTAFEFRLVGDMTLKQFLYLAAGVGTAYLIFVFWLSTLSFLAWPLIAVFALLGVAFAFMPIADRPLDYWLIAFLRAAYSPTKRVWSKNNQSWEKEPIFRSRRAIISQVIASLEATPAAPATVKIAPSIPSAAPAPATLPPVSTTPPAPVAAPPAPPIVQTEPVKVVTAPKIKAGQIVLTTSPNVISGIVTDSAGNYLEGVVVIIYDKTNLPVRALKTNKLGQFSGSTPLPNGTYLIELEKDSLVFDKIQINLKGSVLPPISVAAKKLVGG